MSQSEKDSWESSLLWLNVVVVAWNAGGDLLRSVENLLEAQAPDGGRTIGITIVDNGGDEEHTRSILAASKLRNSGARIRVVGDGKNRGFAGGCNLGAMSGSSRYTIVMNPDVFVDQCELIQLTEILERNPSVSIVGPQLKSQDGDIWRSCAYAPNLASLILASSLGPIWTKVSKAGRFMLDWDHKHERDVDQIIGAIMCVRTAEYQAVGGLDERFFVYYEEVDYCLRIRESGGKIRYAPSCQAVHVGGSSSESDIRRRTFYSIRSRYLYTRKHYGVPAAACVAISSIASEGLLKPFLFELWANPRRCAMRAAGVAKFVQWVFSYALAQNKVRVLERRE
jgi:N-acetylglucosaminyl-diphospho-decaprenol L-rhamnosyltransferase